MRVLCAIHHYPPSRLGGAELRLRRLAQALSARGHTMRVLCVEHVGGGAAGPATRVEQDGAVLVCRLALDGPRELWPYRLAAENPAIARETARWLATDRPDVFWLFGGYLVSAAGLLAARAAGVASLVTLTDFWFLCPRITLLRSDGSRCPWPVEPRACVRCLGEEQRRYRWLARIAPIVMRWFWARRRAGERVIAERRRALRAALAEAGLITCPSEFTRRLFVSAGFSPEQIRVVRQGCDLAAVSPVPRPAGAPLRVGYLGQVAWHKGVHVLLDAVRRAGVPLAVAIHGSAGEPSGYRPQLERRAGAMTGVRFGGQYDSVSLPAMLRELDVVVVPSIWYENNPNVVAEALACGVPVIASAVGGTAELVADGTNGLLVPPGDADELATCLRRLALDPALLARLRAGSGQPMRRVDAEAAEFEQLLAALAAPRAGRAAGHHG